MKNLKVKINDDLLEKNNGVFSNRSFYERNGRLFYIYEYKVEKECFKHTSIELVKEGDYYKVIPTFVITNEMDQIIETLNFDSFFTDKNEYFIYWKDLFQGFIEDISNIVSYDNTSLISLLIEIMQDNPNEVYYYADGNNNEFSLKILDFEIKGTLSESSIYGVIELSDIIIYNNFEILKLPLVYINGLIDFENEDKDLNYLFAQILSVIDSVEMINYILGSMNMFLTK